MEECHKHADVWRGFLGTGQRKALEALQATLRSEVPSLPHGVAIQSRCVEADSMPASQRRVKEGLILLMASEEQSVAEYVGFCGEKECDACDTGRASVTDTEGTVGTSATTATSMPPPAPTNSQPSPGRTRPPSVTSSTVNLPPPPAGNSLAYLTTPPPSAHKSFGGNASPNLRKGQQALALPQPPDSPKSGSAGDGTISSDTAAAYISEPSAGKVVCVKTDDAFVAAPAEVLKSRSSSLNNRRTSSSLSENLRRTLYSNKSTEEASIYRWARSGNVGAIKKLCAGGSSSPEELRNRLNVIDASGLTALHAAMSYGWPEVLQLLLEHGASANPHLQLEGKGVFSAMHVAMGRLAGETLLHAAVRPVPMDVPAKDRERCTQGQIECLRVFLAHLRNNSKDAKEPNLSEINVNSLHQKWTPLHKAAWFGLTEHMNVLLDCMSTEDFGENVHASKSLRTMSTGSCDSRAHERRSSSHVLPWQGRLSSALHNEQEEQEDEEGDGDDVPYLLVNRRDCSGFTALHIACAAGHLECVRALVEVGRAQLNLEGGPDFFKLQEPVPAAAGSRERSFSMASLQGISASKHYTVFHLAAYAGRADVLQYLLELIPPAELAATDLSTDVSTKEVEKCLSNICTQWHLDGSFDGDITHFSALSGSVACLELCAKHKLLGPLQLAVADTCTVSTNQDTDQPSHARELVAMSTPLHLAALEGHTEAVRFLITAGSNLHHENHLGRTPLLEATRGGHMEVLHVLVQAGANVSAMDTAGNSALHLAAAYNHIGAIKVLVERYGPYTPTINRDGQSALGLASYYENTEVVQYLVAQETMGQPWGDAIPDVDTKRRGSYHGTSLKAAAAAASKDANKNSLLVRGGLAVATGVRDSLTKALDMTGELAKTSRDRATSITSAGAGLTRKVVGSLGQSSKDLLVNTVVLTKKMGVELVDKARHSSFSGSERTTDSSINGSERTTDSASQWEREDC